MVIQKWKDAAEFVALLAVVGSLIAVIIELRQTQDALQAQTYQDRAFDAIDLSIELAKDPALNAIYQDGFNGEELSQAESFAAENMLYIELIDLDNEHYQYQREFLDQDYYFGDTVLQIAKMAPLWREFGIRESRLEFRLEVDRILSERGHE